MLIHSNKISLERVQVVLHNGPIAKLHQRSNCGRRCVELRDFILVDNLPVSVIVRIEWCAFELQISSINICLTY